MAFRTFLGLWKLFAEKLGALQSRVVLSVLYFVVVAPFALAVRLFLDPLRIKPHEDSNWIGRSTPSGDLARARHQF